MDGATAGLSLAVGSEGEADSAAQALWRLMLGFTTSQALVAAAQLGVTGVIRGRRGRDR